MPAMQLAAANRIYDMRHEDRPYHDGSFSRWAAEPSRQFPFHYRDGVTIWLSPVELNPEDDFLGQSVGDEALDDDPEAGDGSEGSQGAQ